MDMMTQWFWLSGLPLVILAVMVLGSRTLFKWFGSVCSFIRYSSLRHTGRFAASVAAGAIVLIPLSAIALGWVGLPFWLIESSRYVLSGLAQTVAALLAVCFTLAFVVFQVASARLTAGAANIILRNPALHALVAIGASVILFSFVLLTLIPKAPADSASSVDPASQVQDGLAKLAPASAAAALLPAAVILALVVFFFLHIVDCAKPETLLKVHSIALRRLQGALARGKDLLGISHDISEELRVLAELGERLVHKDEAKVLQDLCDILGDRLAEALKVYDQSLKSGDEDLQASALNVLQAYTKGIGTMSTGAARQCRSKQGSLEKLEADWISPCASILTESLGRCVKCIDASPLKHVTETLWDILLRSGFYPSDHSLPACATKLRGLLDKLTDRALPMEAQVDASECLSGEAVYYNDHYDVLFDRMQELLLECVSSGRIDVCYEIFPETSKSSRGSFFNDWSDVDHVQHLPAQFVAVPRRKLWQVLLSVGGFALRLVFDKGHESKAVTQYLSFLKQMFECPGASDPSDSGFLEKALQDSLPRPPRTLAEAIEYVPKRVLLLHHPEFWLLLRIVLDASGHWPAANFLPGDKVSGDFDQTLRTAQSCMSTPGSHREIRSVLWSPDGPLYSGDSREAQQRSDASFDSIGRAIDKFHADTRRSVMEASIDMVRVNQFRDRTESLLSKYREEYLPPIPVTRPSLAGCTPGPEQTYELRSDLGLMKLDFVTDDASDAAAWSLSIESIADDIVGRPFAASELAAIVIEVSRSAAKSGNILTTDLARFSEAWTTIMGSLGLRRDEKAIFVPSRRLLWALRSCPSVPPEARRADRYCSTLERNRTSLLLGVDLPFKHIFDEFDAILFRSRDLGSLIIVKELEISDPEQDEKSVPVQLSMKIAETVAAETAPDLCWALKISDLDEFLTKHPVPPRPRAVRVSKTLLDSD